MLLKAKLKCMRGPKTDFQTKAHNQEGEAKTIQTQLEVNKEVPQRPHQKNTLCQWYNIKE